MQSWSKESIIDLLSSRVSISGPWTMARWVGQKTIFDRDARQGSPKRGCAFHGHFQQCQRAPSFGDLRRFHQKGKKVVHHGEQGKPVIQFIVWLMEKIPYWSHLHHFTNWLDRAMMISYVQHNSWWLGSLRKKWYSRATKWKTMKNYDINKGF